MACSYCRKHSADVHSARLQGNPLAPMLPADGIRSYDRKIVEVWLTNQDKKDQALKRQLNILFQQYKVKKYSVVEYQSGDQDLLEETSALLCYNRKRLAEQEVRRKKVRVSQRVGAR